MSLFTKTKSYQALLSHFEQVKSLHMRDLFADDAERFDKQELWFLSGEPIPWCWRDPHYRDDEWQPHMAGAADSGLSNYFGA